MLSSSVWNCLRNMHYKKNSRDQSQEYGIVSWFRISILCFINHNLNNVRIDVDTDA